MHDPRRYNINCICIQSYCPVWTTQCRAKNVARSQWACKSASLYSKNVKMADFIGLKSCVGSHRGLYFGWNKKCCLKKIQYLNFWKSANIKNFLVLFCMKTKWCLGKEHFKASWTEKRAQNVSKTYIPVNSGFKLVKIV